MVKDCNVTINIADNTIQKTWLVKDKKTCASTFSHELTCLTALQENFVNEPSINHYPFPKIISANQSTNTIVMTYCGMSVYEIRRSKRKTKQPIDLYNTVKCIVNNLKIADITHGDIWLKNVCMDENGHVRLIDFDRKCITWSWYNKNYYTEPVLSELKTNLEKDTAWDKWKCTPWSILYMF